MPSRARAYGSAPKSVPRAWAANLAESRARHQWRLLALVLIVSVLCTTLITTLSVLVTATESGAVRDSVTTATAAERELRVSISGPSISYAEAQVEVPRVLDELLDGSANTSTTSFALSEMLTIPRDDELFALGYLGELDRVAEESILNAGVWPDAISAADAAVEIALPLASADALHVALGDTFSGRFTGRDQRDYRVVGFYTATEPNSEYWKYDTLSGEGMRAGFPVPGAGGVLATDAIGPAVVAEGTLDALSFPISRIDIREDPTFSALSVDRLIPLTNDLATATSDVPVALGRVGDGVVYSSGLGAVFASVASAVATTRSTVVVVSLLLLVLALVAVAQTARLLSDARAGERSLLRARGASGWHVMLPAIVETIAIVVVTALASPVLARLLYQLIAVQPAMVRANVVADPGISVTTGLIASASALVFGAVLLVPLLAREGTFHEGEQGQARQRKSSGVQRSGIDLAILAVAAVAYWQLISYRTSATAELSLAVDPVIAGAPAFVLLAGALLSVRLVPLVAGLWDRAALGARGIVVPLAAWEVGRRAQRATAAMLLVTLSLAVGTFSLAYLATWSDSQADQAAMALGAPVRVSVLEDNALDTEQELPSGYTGDPQPAVRRSATLVADGSRFNRGSAPQGTDVAVVGLTAEARSMINTGRIGEAGGLAISTALPSTGPTAAGVALGDAVGGIQARVVVESESPVSGVITALRAIVEDERGIVSTVDLGTLTVGGIETVVSGATDPSLSGSLKLVGFQLSTFADETQLPLRGNPQTAATLTIRELGVLDTAPSDDGTSVTTSVDFGTAVTWYTTADERSEGLPKSAFYPDNAQLGVNFTIPDGLRATPTSVVTTSWSPVMSLPMVLSDALATAMRVSEGSRLILVLGELHIPVVIDGVAENIPGGGLDDSYNPLTLGQRLVESNRESSVVDHGTLAHALAQVGYAGIVVDEWWLDVPHGDGAKYVESLQEEGLVAQSRESLTEQLQEHPARIAIYGAIWLVAIGAAIIAALGFAIHATGSLRSRNTEFAQLRAIGLSARKLIGVVALETVLLGAVSSLVGLALGIALSVLVVPVIGVSASGASPVPSVLLRVPWDQLGLLAIEVVLVLATVVGVASRAQRRIDPTVVLRRGE